MAAVGYDVTSGTAGGKVAVEKRGDSWLVTVNNFHFYTISEAVIEGGQPQPATSR